MKRRSKGAAFSFLMPFFVRLILLFSVIKKHVRNTHAWCVRGDFSRGQSAGARTGTKPYHGFNPSQNDAETMFEQGQILSASSAVFSIWACSLHWTEALSWVFICETSSTTASPKLRSVKLFCKSEPMSVCRLQWKRSRLQRRLSTTWSRRRSTPDLPKHKGSVPVVGYVGR